MEIGFGGEANHCTVEEFKELYRFTVTYLRDSLQVHNFYMHFLLIVDLRLKRSFWSAIREMSMWM